VSPVEGGLALTFGFIAGFFVGLAFGSASSVRSVYRTCIEHHPVAECRELKP